MALNLTNIPGYESQSLHQDQNKGPRTIAASIVLAIIASLAVALRLVAQKIVKPSLVADDYCVIISLVKSPTILPQANPNSNVFLDPGPWALRRFNCL